MALSAKTIKGKISSVENVRKITKAMELTSVSKMKRAVASTMATRPYAEEAITILNSLSGDEVEHPLLRHGDNAKNLIIVISSNKGLCGSYNTFVAKQLYSFVDRVEKKHGSTCEFITIGRYSENMAGHLNRPIVASFVNYTDALSLEDTALLSKLVYERFLSGEYFNVVVVHTNFISTLSNEVVARQILPVRPGNLENLLREVPQEEGEVHPISLSQEASFRLYEPDKKEVLDVVLKKLTDVELYHALIESLASEHSSRMVAMKNASENAERLSEELQLSFNRARQAGITREISEIASGADALKED